MIIDIITREERRGEERRGVPGTKTMPSSILQDNTLCLVCSSECPRTKTKEFRLDAQK